MANAAPTDSRFTPARADLGGRVVYFPVRHHSPACAWHVDRLIRDLRPDAVLIEGPRDATRLIPLLTHAKTKLPVAIYTTYVDRTAAAVPGAPPARHAAYYPLCDYSPELAAVRAGAAVGADVKFVDLTYPEMVHAGRREEKAGNLLAEHHFRRSRFLQAACIRAGVRDPDDLWDHLYEVNYRATPTRAFVERVLTYCALARAGSTDEALSADGTLSRERAMAAAIKKEKGRVVVVTGGFHTVALADTPPEMPPARKNAPEDAVVVLMRYGFEQLDRLNGYSAGMPSPDFYQRLWDGRDVTEIFVELGRECRERRQEISVADEIAAGEQCRRLALLRGHAGSPSREDVLDGVRSSFVKGQIDAEGTMVMGIARQLLAGDRVGDVPPEAGLPPIVADFRDTARRLKVELDRVRAGECVLDLYRRPLHRELSRFFYRLRFLEVPFGELIRGPDFVKGTDLARVQEAWKYHWSPDVESRLVERSLYGATLEEAAAGLLQERFTEGERHGQGGRADAAAALLLEACRMGLHRHAPDLLRRTAALVNRDQSFPSLVRAMDELLVLHVSREPLEAHRLEGVAELAGHAYDRACYLIPALVASSEQEEGDVLGALNAFVQAVRTLGDDDARRLLRHERLLQLADAPDGASAALRGGAAGLLFGDGRLDADDLARRFRGHLLAAADDRTPGADFLRGLLRTARSSVWQVPALLADLHAAVTAMEEDRFIHQLPGLRLAFADLTPQETDRVAKAVAKHAGVERIDVTNTAALSSADMLQGIEIDRRVAASLRRDALEEWFVAPLVSESPAAPPPVPASTGEEPSHV